MKRKILYKVTTLQNPKNPNTKREIRDREIGIQGKIKIRRKKKCVGDIRLQKKYCL